MFDLIQNDPRILGFFFGLFLGVFLFVFLVFLLFLLLTQPPDAI